jgi:chromosome segregation ATPase
MSHWRALAYVRDVPDHELRDRLVQVAEFVFDLSRNLEVEERPWNGLPLESVLEHVQELDDRVQGLEDDLVSAEADQREAEDRLEEYLQKKSDGEDLLARIERLEGEKRSLEVRLGESESHLEVYSDALSAARKFVSVASRSHLPTKHVRLARKR